VLTVALARHLPGRRSEAGWLVRVRRDWAHLFPRLPAQSESTGAPVAAGCPRGPPRSPGRPAPRGFLAADRYPGAAGPAPLPGAARLAAGSGRDAAHAERFYGFRLAIRTGLGSRIVRGWGIVPSAANEREVADDLLDGIRPPAGLLLDRGFTGRALAARHAACGTAVVLARSRAQRHQLSTAQRRPVAAPRNRIETTYGDITGRLEPTRLPDSDRARCRGHTRDRHHPPALLAKRPTVR
jgi:hypothetical protein